MNCGSSSTRRGFLRAVAGAAGISLARPRRAEAAARPAETPDRGLQAGAAVVDITPVKFPVVVNGGFLPKSADAVIDPLHARCLVLRSGGLRVALLVVDICVMPREFLDDVKEAVRASTGIPADRILISATHTHTAPAVMGCLGTGPDPHYPPLLKERLVRAVELAEANLVPAKVGGIAVNDFEHTRCRRWIFRSDCVEIDPFGEKTVRAMMHPGHLSTRHTGPSGPIDPGLSLLSVQSLAGRPLALLANYSQHYYGGVKPISADYFGLFAAKMEKRLGDGQDPPFVAMMSQGTSGDLHWMDYSRPFAGRDIDAYAEALADAACQAYRKIEHRGDVPLAMAERKLTLARRTPDEKRLAWGRKIADEMGDRPPRDRREVYALETIYLHEEPSRELKLQAVRIGEVGIAAMSCEVFGLTGLKIKAASPLPTTFNLELANGEDGYIPPPEQHVLGGYTTWPARTAGLEVQAEPKIVETVLQLLEEVSGRGRRKVVPPGQEYADSVLATRPAAFWRLNDMQGPRAVDATGANHGTYEDGVAFYLPGHDQKHIADENVVHRAAHFAGGRMKADVKNLGGTYSVALWFWNGMPADARAVAGYLFSRGPDGVAGAPGDHLGIGRDKQPGGKLFFFNGNKRNEVLTGTTALAFKAWNHVVLVRDGRKVAVFLNGKALPEISGEADVTVPPDTAQVFLGGRNDKFSTFEGKIDEAVLYARSLSAEEAAALFRDTPRS